MLAGAEAVDREEDARFEADKRGDELPPELADRESRLAKMAAARKQLEEDAAAKARKEAEQKARDRGDDDGTVAAKGEDAAAKAEVRPRAQRNFTDPDARIMKTAEGSYHYCYNAQAVVDADHQVIVATDLNNIAVDVHQLVPMTERTAETLGRMPAQWTIDAGYCSAANLEHVKEIETAGGTEFFIATGRLKHGEKVPETPRGRIPAKATPVRANTYSCAASTRPNTSGN